MSDVTGCQKTHVLDCTNSTVFFFTFSPFRYFVALVINNIHIKETVFSVFIFIIKIIYFCFQDIQNKNRRNPNLVIIEKKIDDFLQHWRSRIGLQKQKQVRVISLCSVVYI